MRTSEGADAGGFVHTKSTRAGAFARTQVSELRAALARLGAMPGRRADARDGQAVWMDGLEWGLAQASMRGEGYGRIAAYMGIRGPAIDEETMRTCVDVLQARHPFLRRTVGERVGALAFVPCASPVPITHHEVEGHQPWRALWKGIEARPLVAGGPLAEVHVLHPRDDEGRTTVVVAVEHAASDGACLVHLVCELVELLSDHHRGALAARESLPFSPSVVALARKRVGGWATGLRRLGSSLLDGFAEERAAPHAALARDARASFHDASTAVLVRDLPAAELAALASAAGRERASLASVVAAATSLSLAETCAARDPSATEHHVSVGVTVSLRSRYEQPLASEHLGIHISTIPARVRVAHEVAGSHAPEHL